jgi:hypothetical protein
MHCYGRAAKRRRDREYKRKLKRLHSFGTIRPAIRYVDADYPYKTVNKPYFVKSYKSLGRNKGRYYTYKKVSNRKVRYYKGDLFNGNAYKKLFDL